MSSFKEYYGFMEKYTDFYREVEKKEYEKMDALLSNDLDRIQNTMKDYESYIKKAQQIESERIDLCKKLGFKDMSYSEVLSHFEGEEKRQLSEQKNTLETLLGTIQYLNKKSLEYADMQMTFTEGGTATYNAKGQTDSHLGHSAILNKKI